MTETLKNYARRPSTWRVLALLLAAGGVAVEPGIVEQIGLAVADLIDLAETMEND